MQVKPRVLVVDDDPLVLQVLCRVLGHWGRVEITGAKSGAEALEFFERAPYDLVVTDIKMPGMDGLELARALGQRAPELPIVLITGETENREELVALDLPLLRKPFDHDSFLALIEAVLDP